MEEDSEWLKFLTGAFIVLMLTAVVLIVLVKLSEVHGENNTSRKISPSENSESIIEIGDEIDSFSSSSELHWTHMPITYSINTSCGDFESIRIKAALDKVSIASSNKVVFLEVLEDADIKFICSYLKECYTPKTEEVCPHETSRINLTKANQNLLIRATIEFIGLEGFLESGIGRVSGFSLGECGPLNKEVHAVLRAFGYGSNNDNESIMYGLEEFFPGSIFFNNSQCTTKEIDAGIKAGLSSIYTIN